MSKQDTTILPGQTVFVTKYALTGDGKPAAEVAGEVNGKFLQLKYQPTFYSLIVGKDVFATEREADFAILKEAESKIAKLRKQLDKLEKIRASVLDRLK